MSVGTRCDDPRSAPDALTDRGSTRVRMMTPSTRRRDHEGVGVP